MSFGCHWRQFLKFFMAHNLSATHALANVAPFLPPLCSLLTQQDSPQRHPGSELSARVVCCLSFGSKLAKRQDAQGRRRGGAGRGRAGGVGGKGQADSVVAIVGNAYCITPTRRVASSRVSQRVRAQPDEGAGQGRRESGVRKRLRIYPRQVQLMPLLARGSFARAVDGLQKAQKKTPRRQEQK